MKRYVWCCHFSASFEVTINGELVYSKLETGNFPDFDDVSITMETAVAYICIYILYDIYWTFFTNRKVTIVPIDPSHKFRNASGKYHTMHHFITEMCTHFCYQKGDLWDGYIKWLCKEDVHCVRCRPIRHLEYVMELFISCYYFVA